MAYRTLTWIVVVLHFAYLGYLLFGGFLAWRWRRAIWPHLVAAGWAVAVLAVPLECPLTLAENWSRGRAGGPVPTTGFIDRYVEGVLYPDRFTIGVQAGVAVLVLGSWFGYLARRPRPVLTR
ncbi:DUF2784 domain-containing protein [Plantactinospora sp. GCM10030261]|uniref:DUF2784 domain-containing protein n=1 Tax=Plantactinospora sp. GCM10030261 TaxID=3273420 RepID=UPI00360A496B